MLIIRGTDCNLALFFYFTASITALTATNAPIVFLY